MIDNQSLIIELSENDYWGRIDINNNLIIDYDISIEALKNKIKRAIRNIENVEVRSFDLSFDMTTYNRSDFDNS